MLPVAGKFFAQKTKNLIVVDQKGLETICFLGENKTSASHSTAGTFTSFSSSAVRLLRKTNKVFRATLSIGLTRPPRKHRDAGETIEVERIGREVQVGLLRNQKSKRFRKNLGKSKPKFPKGKGRLEQPRRMGECFFMPFGGSFYGGNEPDENQTAKAGQSKQ